MSAYFSCARGLAIRLRLEQRRVISACGLQVPENSESQRVITYCYFCFRLDACQGFLGGPPMSASPALTLLKEGLDVPFTIFGPLQPDFRFPGLPVFLYWTNEIKRYKE